MYMAIGDCNCGVGFECTVHFGEPGMSLCALVYCIFAFLFIYLCTITTWPCGEESKEGISHGLRALLEILELREILETLELLELLEIHDG